mmetsp:Transcript_14334/g.54022  ORF Transcript_14334/g.54022 Transcript_14334/m.54022 type:complete len:88 (-) Transcript_14334:294-557(-)
MAFAVTLNSLSVIVILGLMAAVSLGTFVVCTLRARFCPDPAWKTRQGDEYEEPYSALDVDAENGESKTKSVKEASLTHMLRTGSPRL